MMVVMMMFIAIMMVFTFFCGHLLSFEPPLPSMCSSCSWSPLSFQLVPNHHCLFCVHLVLGHHHLLHVHFVYGLHCLFCALGYFLRFRVFHYHIDSVAVFHNLKKFIPHKFFHWRSIVVVLTLFLVMLQQH